VTGHLPLGALGRASRTWTPRWNNGRRRASLADRADPSDLLIKELGRP
jgi:hypothetical protein